MKRTFFIKVQTQTELIEIESEAINFGQLRTDVDAYMRASNKPAVNWSSSKVNCLNNSTTLEQDAARFPDTQAGDPITIVVTPKATKSGGYTAKQLDAMNTNDLKPILREMGINFVGKSAQWMREAILQRQKPAKAAPAPKAAPASKPAPAPSAPAKPTAPAPAPKGTKNAQTGVGDLSDTQLLTRAYDAIGDMRTIAQSMVYPSSVTKVQRDAALARIEAWLATDGERISQRAIAIKRIEEFNRGR
jgi:pyruvate/2-oxoglutarate dehydrogenase complex dihydrolipoamide acyltransferase (E2) component